MTDIETFEDERMLAEAERLAELEHDVDMGWCSEVEAETLYMDFVTHQRQEQLPSVSL